MSLTRPNEASLQEAKEILCKRSTADAASYHFKTGINVHVTLSCIITRFSTSCRVKDRTRTQLQRLASFLQATQPFFQQLQPEVIRDVKALVVARVHVCHISTHSLSTHDDSCNSHVWLSFTGCACRPAHHSHATPVAYISGAPIILQVARFLLYERIPVGGILTKQGEKGDHMYIILSFVANVHIRNTTTFKNLVQQVSHSRSLAQRVTSAFAKSKPSDMPSDMPASSAAGDVAADDTSGSDQLPGTA